MPSGAYRPGKATVLAQRANSAFRTLNSANHRRTCRRSCYSKRRPAIWRCCSGSSLVRGRHGRSRKWSQVYFSLHCGLSRRLKQFPHFRARYRLPTRAGCCIGADALNRTLLPNKDRFRHGLLSHPTDLRTTACYRTPQNQLVLATEANDKAAPPHHYCSLASAPGSLPLQNQKPLLVANQDRVPGVPNGKTR